MGVQVGGRVALLISVAVGKSVTISWVGLGASVDSGAASSDTQAANETQASKKIIKYRCIKPPIKLTGYKVKQCHPAHNQNSDNDYRHQAEGNVPQNKQTRFRFFANRANQKPPP